MDLRHPEEQLSQIPTIGLNPDEQVLRSGRSLRVGGLAQRIRIFAKGRRNCLAELFYEHISNFFGQNVGMERLREHLKVVPLRFRTFVKALDSRLT